MSMDGMREIIEQAYEDRERVTPAAASARLRTAVDAAIAGLDSGRLRVA
jgi:2,3,4,5-tetrahydropyridine-2-carboxylate N-succinyltransferase